MPRPKRIPTGPGFHKSSRNPGSVRASLPYLSANIPQRHHCRTTDTFWESMTYRCSSRRKEALIKLGLGIPELDQSLLTSAATFSFALFHLPSRLGSYRTNCQQHPSLRFTFHVLRLYESPRARQSPLETGPKAASLAPRRIGRARCEKVSEAARPEISGRKFPF